MNSLLGCVSAASPRGLSVARPPVWVVAAGLTELCPENLLVYLYLFFNGVLRMQVTVLYYCGAYGSAYAAVPCVP